MDPRQMAENGDPTRLTRLLAWAVGGPVPDAGNTAGTGA
jgi:hypothetical protein